MDTANRLMQRAAFTLLILSTLLLTGCASIAMEDSPTTMTNPVSYFEIPVTDMDRAIAFYEAVFLVELERTVIDGHDMALFPFDEHGSGASGALAKGESYVPSRSGPRIYFFVENLDETLSRAVAQGGQVAYKKTAAGEFWVAEFVDSEGNQVALSAASQ